MHSAVMSLWTYIYIYIYSYLFALKPYKFTYVEMKIFKKAFLHMKTYKFSAWLSLLRSSLTSPLVMKKIVSKGKFFLFFMKTFELICNCQNFCVFQLFKFLEIICAKKFMRKLSVNINFFYCTLSMHFTFFSSHSQCDKIFVVSYFIWAKLERLVKCLLSVCQKNLLLKTFGAQSACA